MNEQSLQIMERPERSEIERFADVTPVISIEQAIQRHRMLSSYVSQVMQEGHDFGAIPGTGTKPTLLKPGAEKLTTLFGLTKRLFIVEKTEDWSGQGDGEPFFYYLYRCALYRGDFLIAEADGSCNSRESKYRWRDAQRKCPYCGAAAIIKGRTEYGGGFVCFGKKGGCGAKFGDDDPAITKQQVGRIANPDIADQVNTIQKMAAKRALIATTLLAVNASEFFTQDIEDFAHDLPPEPPPPAPRPSKPEPPPSPREKPREPSEFTPVAEVIAEVVPMPEPQPAAQATQAESPREQLIIEIKDTARQIKFARNPGEWQQLEHGLLGCSVAQATAQALREAREAISEGAKNPDIVRWNSEAWQCSSDQQAYTIGLIIAHAHLDGFAKTKAIVGEPARLHQFKQIQNIQKNLLSWVRPEQMAEAA